MPTVAEIDIKVGASVDGLKQGVDKVNAQMNKMKSTVSSVGSAVAGSFAAMFTVGAITNFVKSTMDATEKITEMAAAFDASTDGLQRIYYAAGLAGKSTDDVNAALKKLQVNIGKSGQEGGKFAETLEKIGLKSSDIANLPTDQKFIVISKALLGVEDAAKRSAYSMELMGRGGVDIYRAIADSMNDMQDFPVISSEDLDTINKAGDAIDAMVQTLKVEGASAFALWLEGVQDVYDVVDKTLNLVAGNGFNNTVDKNSAENALTAFFSGGDPGKAITEPMDAAAERAEEIANQFATIDYEGMRKEIEELFSKGLIPEDVKNNALADINKKDPGVQADLASKKADEDFMKRLNEGIQRDVNRIKDMSKTPLDTFTEQVQELSDYFNEGAISADQANAAYQKYLDTFNQTDPTLQAAKKADEDAKKNAQEQEDAYKSQQQAVAKYNDDMARMQHDAYDRMITRPGTSFGETSDVGASVAAAQFGGQDNALSIAREQAKKLDDILKELQQSNRGNVPQMAYAG